MVSIEPPSGASSVGDPPDDDDEKTRRSEILKRELAARQELADTMRLAAELRVRNQEALLKKGRDWADKLFDTANMSGPELDDWTLEGIDIFGPDGERAARDARARQTTRRNGQAVSTETGRIIARDRVSGALFTARLVKPVVKSVDATEFAGLDQEIERDPGDADGSPGETVEMGAVEMGPGDEIARIARQAREGGVVTSATTSVAGQLPGRVKQRAKDLKLSRETQARIARTAEDLGEELEITEWLETLGVTIEVPKITRPDISFSDDLENPPAPPPSEPTEGNDELDIGARPSTNVFGPRMIGEDKRALPPGAIIYPRLTVDPEAAGDDASHLSRAFAAGVQASIGNGRRGLAQILGSSGNPVLDLSGVLSRLRSVLDNDADLARWRRLYKVPETAGDALIRRLAEDWRRLADAGQAPEQIRRTLLSRHGAVLERYRVNHRDDALFKAGTRQRAEAEAERERIRAEHGRGGGDGGEIDWMFNLGANAIAGGIAIAGAASGVGAVGYGVGAGAGMLDAMMDFGENENPSDAAVALLVNAMTLGAGAGMASALKGRAGALKDSFTRALAGLAQRDPALAARLGATADDITSVASQIWNSKTAAAANATAQTFAAEMGQKMVRERRAGQEDK